MKERILLVDDESDILIAYRMQLRDKFDVSTAESGKAGLQQLSENGPFAVVIADMRMPVMDGVTFLTEFAQHSPDTVRIMLTGNADLDTATRAVNEGSVFRFLSKPCPREGLLATVQKGVDQYRLRMIERELLDSTLKGSVRVLTEILSLVNPLAFGRSMRIKQYVRHIISVLKMPRAWRYELAAMLSQIGCVSLPGDLLDHIAAGRKLNEQQQSMFDGHPGIAGNLLSNIPRLEEVSQMISGQLTGTVPDSSVPEGCNTDDIRLGAAMLKAAIDFDQMRTEGLDAGTAVARLRHKSDYNPDMLAALISVGDTDVAMVTRTISMMELATTMVADEDIKSRSGLLLLPSGQEVTYTVLARLRNFALGVGIVEPIRVRIRVESRDQKAG